jgi:hypothetical protein
LNKPIIDITLDDIKSVMENKDILREINDYISLRKSKYGEYLYFKTPNHKNPEFISLKKFKEDVNTCDLDIIIDYVNTYKKK